MQKATVYLSLNKPKLTGGIDTYAWLFACAMFLAGWIITRSLIGGSCAFSLVWLAVRTATKDDPKAVFVLVFAAFLKPLYDGAMGGRCQE